MPADDDLRAGDGQRAGGAGGAAGDRAAGGGGGARADAARSRRRRAGRRLRRLRDPVTGEAIDQALLLWFPAPRSETGEDVLEIQHHGGQPLCSRLLLAVLGACSGLSPGRPPASSARRAFLNGKLDLTAAEGLADLIDATTPRPGASGPAAARWRAGPAVRAAGANVC